MSTPTAGEACELYRWLIDRIPDACIIETDAKGIITSFGPGAEAFFRCPAGEVLGRLRYDVFHDPEQMEACSDSEEFRRAMANPGWTEDAWQVIPRTGAPFTARVTLVRLPENSDQKDSGGWVAMYRKISG